MKRISLIFSILTCAFLLFFSLSAGAQQVVTLEPTKAVTPPQPADLLSDRLAGASATAATVAFAPDNLAELVGDRATVYREYQVTGAVSRLYGSTRVDVFQTDRPFASFGLFTYHRADQVSKIKSRMIGSGSHPVGDGVIFWKGLYFVKVTNAAAKNLTPGIAAAVAAKIPDGAQDAERPVILGSLPKEARVGESERYALGAQSLAAHFAGAGEIFSFDGEAEAVVASYDKDGPGAATPLQLVIVEYHTPQFATQALARAESQLASLAEAERARYVVRRVGNFLVGTTNFSDPAFAEQLISQVEYPYVVKWLQNPAIPTDDPFRLEKTATMLVSTISLIGLTGGVVLTGGFMIGTLIFIRRRKQQREVFSDAGGMLRLQLDPLEDTLCGLLPEGEKQ